MNTQEYEIILRDIFNQIINQKDIDAPNRYFAQDVIMYDNNIVIHGLDEAKRLITERRNAIPDYHCTLDDIVISGNKGVVRWQAHGMPLKDIGDFKAGEPINYFGMTLFEFKDGLVSRMWQYGTGVDISPRH